MRALAGQTSAALNVDTLLFPRVTRPGGDLLLLLASRRAGWRSGASPACVQARMYRERASMITLIYLFFNCQRVVCALERICGHPPICAQATYGCLFASH